MLDIQGIQADERGKLLLKWRTTLGWSAAYVAKLFSVTTRTISAIESGAQPMPDARWRLLVHEVLAAISGSSELIVVVNETQALIDVVSSESYSGCVVSDDGRTGLIASHYINRATGMPDVHRQLFSVALNKHVLEATKRWDERRLESVGSSFTIYHWLQRRVLMNELANPKLTQLKAEVTKAQADAVAASQESEEVRKALLQKVDFAIANLMEEAARLTKG